MSKNDKFFFTFNFQNKFRLFSVKRTGFKCSRFVYTSTINIDKKNLSRIEMGAEMITIFQMRVTVSLRSSLHFNLCASLSHGMLKNAYTFWEYLCIFRDVKENIENVISNLVRSINVMKDRFRTINLLLLTQSCLCIINNVKRTTECVQVACLSK